MSNKPSPILYGKSLDRFNAINKENEQKQISSEEIKKSLEFYKKIMMRSNSINFK